MRKKYSIIGLLIFIPVIIASFLSYNITIDEQTIQTKIDESLPISGKTSYIPYEINFAAIDLNNNGVEVHIDGDAVVGKPLSFEAIASGKIFYNNGTFYLTNLEFYFLRYEFDSLTDEKLIEGTLQMGKSWIKQKIDEQNIDDEYKKEFNGRLELFSESFDEEIKKALSNSYIPLYELSNAPTPVRMLGVMITNVTVVNDSINITYSPRILWLMLLSFVAALGLTLTIFVKVS